MSIRHFLLGLFVAGFCAASVPAFAQMQRVRGTVESIHGDNLVVKTTAGTDETVILGSQLVGDRRRSIGPVRDHAGKLHRDSSQRT